MREGFSNPFSGVEFVLPSGAICILEDALAKNLAEQTRILPEDACRDSAGG